MATLNKLAIKFSLTLSAISLLCASSCVPAQAITLNGRLETTQERALGKGQDRGGTDSGTDFGNNADSNGGHSTPGQIQNAAPTAAQLNPNTFAKAYQGSWACQTTVVNSSAPSVTVGQVIDSEVSFYPTATGLIKARWSQAGWVETQSTASSYGKNNDEAKSDRTTYFFGDNAQGSWAARARDQFALTAPDTIQAKSYVDQYVDGQYVGRYRTVSILKKTSDDTTIADAN